MPGIGLGLGLPFGANIPSPVFVSATIEQATPTVVTIVMDIALDETYTATDEITLAGKTVSSVTVSGTDITVTVSVAFAYGDTPTVVYTKGTLKGATGGSVASFSETVTNNIIPYFITTWETENAGSATKTIVIPTTGAGYDFWVDWGDGGAEENFSGIAPATSHVYATTGIKTISIRGTFPRIYFDNGGDKLKLLTIAQWGDIAWSSMERAFYGCGNLTGTYTDIADTTAVTSMYLMFRHCSLFNSPINFNTSLVTTMAYMFDGCSVFNQDVSTFDVRLVTTMNIMFSGANALSTANYDALLISWAAQAVQDNVPFHAGDATYTENAVDSGTTDGVAAGKLIQSGQNFITTVTVNDVIHNTTDGTYAIVTAIDSDTQLSISVDIMANGEDFVIQHSDAAKGRAELVITHNWTITCGGPV